MDGDPADWGEGGEEPHRVLRREPEDVLPLADDDESLKSKKNNENEMNFAVTFLFW